MKFLICLALVIITLASHSKTVRIRFSQKYPPPTLFARGIISTEDDEFGASFTPDGQTCYFVKKTPSTLVSSTYVICVSQKKGDKWGQPQIASFSGRYADFNPCVSPDGRQIFFISARPVEGKKGFDPDIWVVTKMGEGWGEPKNLGAPINTAGWELGCSVAANGTLYFSSSGTTGNVDLYSSKFVDGHYQQPDTLGPAINSPYPETDPFVAPDESYILFASQGRPDAIVSPGAGASYPRGDLYISFHKNGSWTKAINLGAPFNSDAEESNPFVSHDGKTFYYTSERNFVTIPMKEKLDYSSLEKNLHGPGNGLGDIYQVPFAAILNKSN